MDACFYGILRNYILRPVCMLHCSMVHHAVVPEQVKMATTQIFSLCRFCLLLCKVHGAAAWNSSLLIHSWSRPATSHLWGAHSICFRCRETQWGLSCRNVSCTSVSVDTTAGQLGCCWMCGAQRQYMHARWSAVARIAASNSTRSGPC